MLQIEECQTVLKTIRPPKIEDSPFGLVSDTDRKSNEWEFHLTWGLYMQVHGDSIQSNTQVTNEKTLHEEDAKWQEGKKEKRKETRL